MSQLLASYWIEVFDPSATKVAELDDYRMLQFGHKVNDVASWSLLMNGDDERTVLFEPEGLVRIQRFIPGLLPAYTEYEGIIEDFRDEVLENGNRQFRVGGGDPNSLLKRRYILWPEGTSQTGKSDYAETVMKEYVRENLGAGALYDDGRDMDGYDSRVTVAASEAAGPLWDGSRTRKNLFSVIQEIARYTRDRTNPIDFRMDATDVLEWTFNTYEDQIGTDRSYTDMDTAAGLNGAGNAPVILSRERGNVSRIAYSKKHTLEKNAVAALGSGVGSLREVITRTDDSAIDLSGQREGLRVASTNDTDELTALADAELSDKRAAEALDIVPLQQASALYGLHYEIGDIITSLWKKPDGTTTRYHKRLMSVSITVSPSGETFNFNFKDV